MLNFSASSLANAATWPGILNQIPEDIYTCTVIYWIAIALATGFALHSAFASSFLYVFGQRLAYYGQEGSVNKAIEIIVQEQFPIFCSSMLSVFCFGFSLIFSYFWVMSTVGAVLTALSTIFVMYMWYSLNLNIYNNFKVAIEIFLQ